MKQQFRNIVRIAALFQIALVLSLILNSAVNTHTHTLEDGTVVTHAHPFSKSNNENGHGHTHSSLELTILVNVGLFFLIAVSGLLLVNLFKAFDFVTNVQQSLFKGYVLSSSGRAPPYIL